jgi:beta-phosphoglucomutase-like phosphatase (HAD superfamily)
VLFDVEGTLVDTESYWLTTEYAPVQSLGGRSHEDRRRPARVQFIRSYPDYSLRP